MEKDHKVYFDIMRIGRGNEYAGAGYFSWRYSQKLVILTNIIRLTDSPNDRILVSALGAGHNKLLNQLAKDQIFSVESPLKYLRSKKVIIFYQNCKRQNDKTCSFMENGDIQHASGE